MVGGGRSRVKVTPAHAATLRRCPHRPPPCSMTATMAPFGRFDAWRDIGAILGRIGLILTLLAACTPLPPARSPALKDAQQFVDEVTAAYGAGHVRVILGGSETGYHGDADVITIGPPYFGSNEQRVVLAAVLGAPTLKLRTSTPANLLAANRQGVKIMVQFLGMSQREAIDRLAALLVTSRQSLRDGERRVSTRDWRVVWHNREHLHPCEQLRALWASYALAAPQPPCDPAFGP